jgi:hypothetical protein
MAQSQWAEVRIAVTDAMGLALPSDLNLVSEATRTERITKTNDAGEFDFQHVPFGIYRLTVSHVGFAPYSSVLDLHATQPRDIRVQLDIKSESTEVTVTDTPTVIDPYRTGVAYNVGAKQISEEQSNSPGRGLLELVDDQPGWLFEANGVLHPRGSEYDTLMVVDGVPMDENRSAAFAPGLQAAEVSSLSVMTGNIPAEYGRKLGGVVEITTSQDIKQGFHGEAEVEGGSFGTESGFLSGEYGWKRSAVTISASESHTDRYLDPPVLGNFTNTGTSDGVTAIYDFNPTDSDRLHFTVDRRQSSFEVPNENLQQAAGQRQDRNSIEDLGQVAWTHTISPSLVLNVRSVFEDLSANLWSNTLSTPIVAAQQRGFRRGYVNASVAGHYGHHDIKVGADFLYAPVTEALQYELTDPTYFDPGTPGQFNFLEHRLDREQALWAQDTIRLKNLTISAGIRFDHYSLAVSDHAFSPRLGLAYYLPKTGTVLRFSYDRVFQTPAIENLLLASSPQVDQVDPLVLRIPIQPSRGNYIEAGLSQQILGKARLDVSFYRRSFVNYSDDDVFLNTGVSFPISFQSAQIRGVDVKLDLPSWKKFSGYLSYSNMLGVAQLPVTGGLFLGSDAVGILGVTSSFPVSQDQRNTARGRLRYQVSKRLWVASSAQYGSGLPVELPDDTSIDDLIAQYGSQIVSRLNLNAGRVRPNFSLDFGAGFDVWKHEKSTLKVQGEFENVTNKLNVIDFAGLFSGTAIGTPRSGSVRVQFSF